MIYRAILLVGLLSSGIVVLAAQQPNTLGVFTPAQAEAGRKAYERTCGKCHTNTLMGRNGGRDELPPIDSLPASYQEFIGKTNRVPPLAGKVFLSRWGQKQPLNLSRGFKLLPVTHLFSFTVWMTIRPLSPHMSSGERRKSRHPGTNQNDHYSR